MYLTPSIFAKRHTKSLAVTVVSLLLSGTALADVTLKVDDNIKVTAINGQAVNKSLFKPTKRNFTIKPGTAVITAKYERLYDLRRDDHDFVRSSNLTITAPLQDNMVYRLTMPGQPEAYRAAKEYAEKPTLAIVQGSQTITQSTTTLNNNDDGMFSGITEAVGGIFKGNDDALTSNQTAIAALESSTRTTTVATTPTISPVINTATNQVAATKITNNASTLDSFMQLWLQATPEERTKIRQWVQE